MYTTLHTSDTTDTYIQYTEKQNAQLSVPCIQCSWNDAQNTNGVTKHQNKAYTVFGYDRNMLHVSSRTKNNTSFRCFVTELSDQG